MLGPHSIEIVSDMFSFQNLDYVNEFMHTTDSGTARVGLAQLLGVGFQDHEKWKVTTKVPPAQMPAYRNNLEDVFKVWTSSWCNFFQ